MPATAVWPRQTSTTSPNTPPHARPSSIAVRNSFQSAPVSRDQTIGPSVRLCRVSVSACMLTLSPSASTIGMKSDSTTTSCSRCSKRLAMNAASRPPAMLQSSHGNRSRNASPRRLLRGAMHADQLKDIVVGPFRQVDHFVRKQADVDDAAQLAGIVHDRECQQPPRREVFAGDEHRRPVGNRDHVRDHDVANQLLGRRRKQARASARRRPAFS